MLDRIITGILLTILFLGFILYLPLYYTGLIFTIISLYGFYEWLKISKNTNKSIILNLITMIVIMISLLLYYNHTTVRILSYLSFIIWLFILLDIYFGSKIYKKLLINYSSSIGLFMITVTWFLIMSLGSTSSASVIEDNQYLLFSMTEPNIRIYLLSLITVISLSDASGYFFGKIFGNAKLCEDISPNKTIVGFIGSLMVPIIFFILLFTFILDKPYMIEDLLFMLLCCIYCTVGDLFMSIYKRFRNVKDTGSILPGHGGILDRVDSYLPTVSIFQIWLFL